MTEDDRYIPSIMTGGGTAVPAATYYYNTPAHKGVCGTCGRCGCCGLYEALPEKPKAKMKAKRGGHGKCAECGTCRCCIQSPTWGQTQITYTS